MLENSKEDKPLINFSLLNKRFSKLLIEERPKLDDYINRDKGIVFKKEPVKANDKILFLLNKVLNVLENDYVITVIYGRFFKIISQFQVSEEYNKSVNIFIDLGGDLVKSYFYALYRKEKKKELEKKGVLEYQEYKLSNWRSENKEIISLFTPTTKADLGAKVIGWLKYLDLIRFKVVTISKTEKQSLIIPTDRVIGLLDEETKIKPLPRRLPMIVKPKLWKRIIYAEGTKEILGGCHYFCYKLVIFLKK